MQPASPALLEVSDRTSFAPSDWMRALAGHPRQMYTYRARAFRVQAQSSCQATIAVDVPMASAIILEVKE